MGWQAPWLRSVHVPGSVADRSRSPGPVFGARQRRIAYLSGIVLGIPGLGVSWLAEPSDHGLLRGVYVAMALSLVAAGAWMLRRPDAVVAVERATLLGVAVLWTVRLAYQVHAGGSPTEVWGALMPWAFMGVPLLAVFGYIVLPARWALAGAAALALCVAALTIPTFVAGARADGDWVMVQALLRYEVYLAVTLCFVHLLARTKDALVGAELEAERMRTMAYRDPLTGLRNRRALTELLDREVDAARRTPLSVVALDLDRFKDVNDTLGHHAGDLVLQATALCLQTELRAGDTVGRWGGEEFLVVCPGAALPEATALAQRLRTALERDVRVEDLTVTGSFGVVQYATGMSVADLLGRADQLMYEAKLAGRNRVVAAVASHVAPRSVPVEELVPGQTHERVLARLDVTTGTDSAVEGTGERP